MAQPKLLLISILAMAVFTAPTSAKSIEPAADTLIVKRNFQGAFQQLLARAKSGDSAAMFKLSSAYRYGLGTARNINDARHWMELSANAGNAKAKLALKRWATEVQPTAKKLGLAEGAAAPIRKIDFSKLPPRAAGAQPWVVVAAAQKDHGAVTALAKDAPPEALLAAATLGDAESLKALPALSAKDGAGRDVIMVAKGEALDLLLANKPDLASADKAGQTAVSLAAEACDAPALTKLIAAGASLSAPVAALPIAVQRCADFSAMMPIFEKQDSNVGDSVGRSASWFAAKRGNKGLIAWLSSQGADLSKADALGFTPLHAAAASAQPEALRLLLPKGANQSVKSLRGVTPLMLAAASGCTDCLTALLVNKAEIDEKDADGDTALMFAVRALQAPAAQILSDSGANSNAKNGAGDAPAKLAIRLGMAKAPK